MGPLRRLVRKKQSAIVGAATLSNAELNMATRMSSVFRETLSYLKGLAIKTFLVLRYQKYKHIQFFIDLFALRMKCCRWFNVAFRKLFVNSARVSVFVFSSGAGY